MIGCISIRIKHMGSSKNARGACLLEHRCLMLLLYAFQSCSIILDICYFNVLFHVFQKEHAKRVLSERHTIMHPIILQIYIISYALLHVFQKERASCILFQRHSQLYLSNNIALFHISLTFQKEQAYISRIKHMAFKQNARSAFCLYIYTTNHLIFD